MRIIPGEGVQDVLLHVSVLLRRERLRENVGELSRRVAVLDVHDLGRAPLADLVKRGVEVARLGPGG